MVEFLNELDHEQFFQTTSINNKTIITHTLPYSSNYLFVHWDLPGKDKKRSTDPGLY
jgi:hypothetical protein